MQTTSQASQWLFSNNAEHNRALNILNQNCESCVTGMEYGALQFAWRAQSQSADTLSQAILDLRQSGLITMTGAWLRLTDAGLARVFAEDVECAADSSQAGQPNVLSEYELRNRALAIFSENDSTLPADEIHRRWQAARQRAGDLRNGLDLLMRDGYIKRGRIRKTVFRIQDAGLAYLNGKPADEYLKERSPPASREAIELPGTNDPALIVIALHAFDKHLDGRTATFATLDYYLEEFRVPAPLRFHAIELLHRFALVAPNTGTTSAEGFALTRSGRDMLEDAKARSSLKRVITVDLKDARDEFERAQEATFKGRKKA